MKYFVNSGPPLHVLFYSSTNTEREVPMMRRLSLTNLTLKLTLLAILSVLLLPVTARNQQTSPKQEEMLTVISSLDHAFFEAYNKCELRKIESLFTTDIEFYHEKRGQLTSKSVAA